MQLLIVKNCLCVKQDLLLVKIFREYLDVLKIFVNLETLQFYITFSTAFCLFILTA